MFLERCEEVQLCFWNGVRRYNCVFGTPGLITVAVIRMVWGGGHLNSK